MRRRDQHGQYAKRRSPVLIVVTWLGSFASLGLLVLMAVAVKSDFAGFRSCSINNSGLTVTACGKGSLNPGDILLLALFGLSAVLMLALFTAAWRMVRSRHE